MENTQAVTPLSRQIGDYQAKTKLVFKPTKAFYDKEGVGINRIRFWQLVEGKKTPLLSEAQRIAAYFKVDIQDIFQ